jgi:hypothetical protein
MAMIFLLINYLPDFFINQLIRRGRRALINGWAASFCTGFLQGRL